MVKNFHSSIKLAKLLDIDKKFEGKTSEMVKQLRDPTFFWLYLVLILGGINLWKLFQCLTVYILAIKMLRV